MSRELMDRGFQDSAYERPNVDWQCGWTSEGRPCPLGPSAEGHCVVTHQCTPSLRGDRWMCARTRAHGDTCDEGPSPDGTCCKAIPPCQPKRSQRARRGRLSRWTAGVTVALLALAVTGDGGRDFISPGKVSMRHGSVGECTECHAAGAGGAANWFTAAFHAGLGSAESERCLGCHDATLGETPLLPHSVPMTRLDSIRSRMAALPDSGSSSVALAVARIGGGVPTASDGSLACTSCHKEHRGRDHDIKALGNDQCQVCHIKPFGSLESGHPEFTSYPYERRTRIQFNHISHRDSNFPERRSFVCQDCHRIDPDGQVMLVISYETACGGCHAMNIDTTGGQAKKGFAPGESPEGVAFLHLPGFDTDVLAEEGVEIGEWPEEATLDIDGTLNAFMRLLLSADESAAEALALLPDDMVYNELDDPSEEEFAALGDLAWGVKGLLYDLVSEGQSALHERIETALDRPVSSRELAILSGNLEIESVAAAARAWFPGLAAEVDAQRSGRVAATSLVSSEPPELEAEVGWMRSDLFTFSYRPSGHEDEFLRRWLDVSMEPAEGPSAELRAGLFDLLVANDSDLKPPGRCVSCHSVDVVGDAAVVNWQQKRRDLLTRGPNRFLHRPHVTALSSARDIATDDPTQSTAVTACVRCHTLAPEGTEATDESFAGTDPHVFTSNFRPLEKATCTSCHVSGEASDSCLNCHNYHVGEPLETVSGRAIHVGADEEAASDEGGEAADGGESAES